jgi:hypothetical protein
VAAEHHHFLGLIGAGNLGDDVIDRGALGDRLFDDVEFDFDWCAVGENARNAAVVFIAGRPAR